MQSRLLHHTFKSLELYIIIDKRNAPWFKANEVVAFLGLAHLDTVHKCELYKLIYNVRVKIPSDWSPNLLFINETGLNNLIKHSHMEEFKEWIESDVMPPIRNNSENKKTLILQVFHQELSHGNMHKYTYIRCQKQHLYRHANRKAIYSNESASVLYKFNGLRDNLYTTKYKCKQNVIICDMPPDIFIHNLNQY